MENILFKIANTGRMIGIVTSFSSRELAENKAWQYANLYRCDIRCEQNGRELFTLTPSRE